MDVPETGADGLWEVAERDERAVGLALDRQLRQRPRGRTRDRLRATEHVELRLMARADQRVLRFAVQPHRAAGVRADLRVRDIAVRRPRRVVALELELPRVDADE